MSALDALERYLLKAGKGVGKLKGMKAGEIGEAGLDLAADAGKKGLAGAKKYGTEALDHFKANKSAGGVIAGAGAVGGASLASLLGDDDGDDEEALRKKLLENYY